MIFKQALRRELMNVAGAVFMTLFTITITMMIIRILGQAARGRVATEDVFALIGFSALQYSPIILILTGFIAVLLVITRSYQDSEMVVWFASGLSLTRWLRPILEFAIPISVIVLVFSFFLTPWAHYQNIVYRARFEQREDLARLSPGKFQESSDGLRVFFVERMAQDMSFVEHIFMHSVRNNSISMVVANEGSIQINDKGERFFVLNDGIRYEQLPESSDFRLTEFDRYSSILDQSKDIDFVSESIRSMSNRNLWAHLEINPKAKGELLWRMAQPIMAFLLMFLAVPLGFVNPRAGRSFNLILALLLYAAYSNLTSVMQSLVTRERLPLWLGWWPLHLVIFLIILGLYVWRLQINHPKHPLLMLVSFRNKKNWLNFLTYKI